jgi:hypothetical protein
MKKDSIFLLSGLALGAVVFFVFKDDILGKKKKSSPPQTPPPSGGSISGGYMNTGIGAPNQVMQGQTQITQTQQEQAPPPPPYALNAIDPSLASTQVHQDLFGGCNFPILPDDSSICVRRLQDAFGVEQSGSFDLPTQEAYDDYIEMMPNRADGFFAGYGREGCIVEDPISGDKNLCGLNHDQYLDVLFKMGIPLTRTYDE